MAQPSIIRKGTILTMGSYNITPTVIGSFDTTDAGTNNALIVMVNYTRPTNTDSDDITGCTFDGVAMTLIGIAKTNANSLQQPRVAAYIMNLPTKKVGDIAVSFNVNINDASSEVSVTPILFANVKNTSAIGTVINSYLPVVNYETNRMDFDSPIGVQTPNSLVVGSYFGATGARNSFLARGTTTQYSTGSVTFPNARVVPYWMGTMTYSNTGVQTFSFSETVYPDTCSTLYFELLSADIVPSIVAPFAINADDDVTLTFTGVQVTPTTVMLSDGVRSQPLTVTNDGGVFTIHMPSLLNNKVLYGTCTLEVTDNAITSAAIFTYKTGYKQIVTLSSAADPNAYPGWSILPASGDQLIFDPYDVVIDTAGYPAAYLPCTAKIYWFKKAAAETVYFNSTFNEPTVTSIDSNGTTVNLTAGATATIKINLGKYLPREVMLIDKASGVGTRQTDFVFNGTDTITYTVAKTYERFNGSIDITVIMTNGSRVTIPGSIVGFVGNANNVVIPLNTIVKVRATKPYLDGTDASKIN